MERKTNQKINKEMDNKIYQKKSELLKSYEEELSRYLRGIKYDYFFGDLESDAYCITRDDLENLEYKDDRLRKLDTILFIELTKRIPDNCQYCLIQKWYYQIYYIHKKVFPIELLPDYLQPLYQKYLDGSLVIPDDIPKDVLPLYKDYLKGVDLRPALNLDLKGYS